MSASAGQRTHDMPVLSNGENEASKTLGPDLISLLASAWSAPLLLEWSVERTIHDESAPPPHHNKNNNISHQFIWPRNQYEVRINYSNKSNPFAYISQAAIQQSSKRHSGFIAAPITARYSSTTWIVNATSLCLALLGVVPPQSFLFFSFLK